MCPWGKDAPLLQNIAYYRKNSKIRHYFMSKGQKLLGRWDDMDHFGT